MEEANTTSSKSAPVKCKLPSCSKENKNSSCTTTTTATGDKNGGNEEMSSAAGSTTTSSSSSDKENINKEDTKVARNKSLCEKRLMGIETVCRICRDGDRRRVIKDNNKSGSETGGDASPPPSLSSPSSSSASSSSSESPELSTEEASTKQEDTGSSPSSSQQKLKPFSFKPPENWVDAPEFVPRWMMSTNNPADLSKTGVGSKITQSCGEPSMIGCIPVVVPSAIIDSSANQALQTIDTTSELCPYAMVGECRYGFKCLLVHGLKCEYCGQSCLHPEDSSQRQRHLRECVDQHERDMELSFAVARSIDKVCGVCYEKVMSKYPAGEQRFGILPSCNHIFCLSCIRRWRQERQFDNKTIRACPECRVTSDFVCPSRYWVDNKEEKDKLIGSYKVALSKKPCRYYRSGEGQCPFGNKCFYLHALPDGTVVDVGPPRRISGAQGRVRSTNQTLSVWEYIEEWEMQWLDLEDFMGMFDSDTASEFSFPDVDVVDLEGDDELGYLDWERS